MAKERDAPITLARFAERLGKSRLYYSRLLAKGVLHGPPVSLARLASPPPPPPPRRDEA